MRQDLVPAAPNRPERAVGPPCQKFFTRYFEWTLISDFWSPYDAVACDDRQKCWPHLLRDVAAVDEQHPDDDEWCSFSRRLVGVYRDARKLHDEAEMCDSEVYQRRTILLERRLINLGTEEWNHPDAQRLAKRALKYSSELLTFLWYDDIPSDNNGGERAIRPAVMIRKNSYANQSERGALTQSVLMTIFRTLRLRNLQPINTINTINTILTALTTDTQTGTLPPLPNGPPAG